MNTKQSWMTPGSRARHIALLTGIGIISLLTLIYGLWNAANVN